MTQKYGKIDCREELDFALDLDFSEILTNPILDIAAHFWEEDRYRAFQVCYRSMRRIDDLVDDRKEVGSPLNPQEIVLYQKMISHWLRSFDNLNPTDSFQKEFIETRKRYSIPAWPWIRLCKAMIYDLNHNGFKNLPAFLRYSEGAAIAPASVFMHLCGIRLKSDLFSPPDYDIRLAARQLALFSYLVHIIRDFEIDQKRSLNYFASDLIERVGLTVGDLQEIARSGLVPDSFRELVRLYKGFAAYYRRKARQMINSLKPFLKPRYRLSLEIIYGLYDQIYERIDPAKGNFTTRELNPPPELIQKRVDMIIADFSKNR